MADRLLVVEGEEDKKLFQALLRRSQTDRVEVVCHPAGKGNAIATYCASVAKQTKSSQAQLGLVVDADLVAVGGSGIGKTVADLNAKLMPLGLRPLTKLAGGGFEAGSMQYTRCRFGVWVMPNGEKDGYVENLLVDCIAPAESARFDYAQRQCEAALADAPSLGFPVRAHHMVKAELGTWLAWQDPPRMSFAAALERGLFDERGDVMSSLSAWLKSLYK